MSRNPSHLCAAVQAASLLLAVACAAPEPVGDSAAARAVEMPSLGLRLTDLPAGFSAPREDRDRFELDAPLAGVAGTAALWIEPRTGAVNLVEEARRFGEQAAAAPGGEFHGGNELVTGYGPAYTARAAVEGGAVEERRTFLLHPDGSERLLVVSLRHPPGGAQVSRARLQQVLELLQALEPAGASG